MLEVVLGSASSTNKVGGLELAGGQEEEEQSRVSIRAGGRRGASLLPGGTLYSVRL